MADKWETLQRKLIRQTPIFDIQEVARRAPTGEQGDFWIVEPPDWINVVALTPDERVVLVEQYRHGTDEVTVEIPGGQVDPGESALETAKRELREETGFVSDDWQKLGSVAPNPAFITNECMIYLADGARQVGEPDLDEFEDIEVSTCTQAGFFEKIDNGTIDHALVVSAAYFFRRWLDNRDG